MPLLNIFKPDVEKLAAQGDMQSLRKLLSHGDSTIRLKAARALADLGPAGIDILIAALNSNNRREIETAKDGLVSAGAAAVEPLIKTGENLIDSYEISNTLEKIGKPAIEPMIKTALENSKASTEWLK